MQIVREKRNGYIEQDFNEDNLSVITMKNQIKRCKNLGKISYTILAISYNQKAKEILKKQQKNMYRKDKIT